MDFSIIYVTAKALDNEDIAADDSKKVSAHFVVNKWELAFIVLVLLICSRTLTRLLA